MSIANMERTSPNGGYYNMKDKLARYVFELSEERFQKADEARKGINTEGELREYTDRMRKKLISSMGGIPYDPSLPLNAKITGVIEEPDLTIEKIIFESRPGVYVTANLYLPRKRKNPCGAVLFQCGHSREGKGCLRYQRVIRMIASAGLIVLAMDPVGQGERFSYMEEGLKKPMVEPCTYDHQYAGHQCFLTGDSPTRYFLADAMRAVDYLQTRPEVDPQRIGATGNSGGGTMTSHMMVCDKRIYAAAPGTFITNRREYLHAGSAQDTEQIWLGGTDFGFDHHELLMCFAPKPLLILAVDYDFFPIEGAQIVYEECKRFWSLGKSHGHIELYRDKSLHCYSDNLGIRAASFFAEFLNGERREADADRANPIEESALWCTKSGQVALDFPNAKFVFHENLARFEEKKNELMSKTEAERRGEAVAFLREKIYANRRPCDFNVRHLEPVYENGLRIQPYMWFSQKRMPCFGLEFRDFRKVNEKLPVVICLWDNGTDDLEGNMHRIRKICEEGKAAFVADLSGIGKCTPHDLNHAFGTKENYGVIDRLTKDLFFINDSMCALRAFDLERTIQMLSTLDNTGDISLFTKGNAAVYAKIVGLLNEKLKIETAECIESLADIVKSKYYENYNISGIIIPGLAIYI